MFFQELGEYIVQGLTSGAVYALFAVGLSLVYGSTGIVNFPCGDVMAVSALLGGASLSYNAHVPMALVIVITVIAGGALSAGTSFVLLPPFGRRDPHTDHGWIIAAVALSTIISGVASVIWGSQEVAVGSPVGPGTVTIFSIIISHQAIVLFVVAVALGVLLDQAVRHTRWGMRVRATGGDRIAVVLSGISQRSVQIQVFAVAGALVAVAGLLFGPLGSVNAFMGFQLTVQGFIAATIGGLGNIRGALFGGLLLGIVESLGGWALGSQWQEPLSLLVLIVILVVRPTGLFRTRQVRHV